MSKKTTATAKKAAPKSRRKKQDDDADNYERPLMDPPPDENIKPPHKQERPSTEIKKAKIKNELFLEVEYTENIQDGTNTVKKDCTAPIHNDLKNAFKKLDAHLSGISEQYTEKGELDMDNVTCRGFSIGGDGEGVILFGFRKLSNGKALNFLSPFHKWDGETVEYESSADLRVAITQCKTEVIKYLFENKHQPDIQGKLDL